MRFFEKWPAVDEDRITDAELALFHQKAQKRADISDKLVGWALIPLSFVVAPAAAVFFCAPLVSTFTLVGIGLGAMYATMAVAGMPLAMFWRQSRNDVICASDLIVQRAVARQRQEEEARKQQELELQKARNAMEEKAKREMSTTRGISVMKTPLRLRFRKKECAGGSDPHGSSATQSPCLQNVAALFSRGRHGAVLPKPAAAPVFRGM